MQTITLIVLVFFFVFCAVLITSITIFVITNRNLKRFRYNILPGQTVFYFGKQIEECKVLSISNVAYDDYIEFELETISKGEKRKIYTVSEFVYPKKISKFFMSFF